MTLSPLNIQSWCFCSSIRNCITYANEGNIVNKHFPIYWPHDCRINDQDPDWIKQHIDAIRHNKAREDVRGRPKQPLNSPGEDHQQTKQNDVEERSYNYHTDLFHCVQQCVLIVQIHRVGLEFIPVYTETEIVLGLVNKNKHKVCQLSQALWTSWHCHDIKYKFWLHYTRH